jgi:hypothetical protein
MFLLLFYFLVLNVFILIVYSIPNNFDYYFLKEFINNFYDINFQSNDEFCKIHIYYFFRLKINDIILIYVTIHMDVV